MKRKAIIFLLVCLFFVPSAWGFGDKIRVMDWNVYIGTDVFAVFEGYITVDQAVEQVIDSDINGRALTIAKQIELLRPDVVFLQEVFQVALLECTSSDPSSCTVSAYYDFLAVFKAALVNYDVAGVQELTKLPLPYSSGYVYVKDRNVILVRKGAVRPAGGATEYAPDYQLYAEQIEVPVDSTTILIKRGYTTVPVEIRDTPYLLANTHLEVFFPYRENQAGELASVLGDFPENVNVILGGDINDVPGSDAYNALTGAGFIDRWNGGWDDGFTCCQDADLLNKISALDEQIDFVFTLNGNFRTISGRVIGDKWYDKTLTIPRLWPSDHAGLIFTLYSY